MTSLDGLPILTAARMRAAEGKAIAAGTSVDTLMARAGSGIATWVARLAGGREVLVLCGPGNNGGDGYVVAARLKQAGLPVRVAASGPPATAAAIDAHRQWGNVVEDAMTAPPAPILVDALFGTGLSRPLAPQLAARLHLLAEAALFSITVDLPSGVVTDDGTELGDGVPQFDLTLTPGALKPAHLLQPAASRCGAIRVVDIGLDIDASPDRVIARPRIARPDAAAYKYSRGLVAVIAGAMPGAAVLASAAALHAGAGYVLALGDGLPGLVPSAIVQRPWSASALSDALVGKGAAAAVVGPGLGRDREAAAKLTAAIATERPLVVDGDALHLLDATHFAAFARRAAPVVLTPHAGEFGALFGHWQGSKIDAARDAARRSGTIVVFKGADTVVAHPDGTARVALPGSSWLSTAGTGDVLAGAIGAMLAAGVTNPAEAGVWLHAEAARRLGGPFIADDLARALTAARASL